MNEKLAEEYAKRKREEEKMYKLFMNMQKSTLAKFILYLAREGGKSGFKTIRQSFEWFIHNER